MQNNYVKTSRAVILNSKKDAVISIKRTKYKDGKEMNIYYTFPGGHVEENETYEETLKREIFEELSVEIEILRQLKLLFNDELKREEKFFLCEIKDGEVKEGNGPEFTNIDYEKYGKYEIVEIKIKDIDKYNLLPFEIKEIVKNI